MKTNKPGLTFAEFLLLLLQGDFSVLYLLPVKNPSQLLYSPTVLRNDEKKQFFYISS